MAIHVFFFLIMTIHVVIQDFRMRDFVDLSTIKEEREMLTSVPITL